MFETFGECIGVKKRKQNFAYRSTVLYLETSVLLEALRNSVNGWFGHKIASKYGILGKFGQKPKWYRL